MINYNIKLKTHSIFINPYDSQMISDSFINFFFDLKVLTDFVVILLGKYGLFFKYFYRINSKLNLGKYTT